MVGDWKYYLLLLAIDMLNGERSLPAVIHLLRGRKNHQVMQDCALFGTSLLYGELSMLSVHQLQQHIMELKSAGLVQITSQPSVFCTEEGKKILKEWNGENRIQLCINAFPAIGHKVEAAHFWLRLELLIQTLSHLIQGVKNFYPVVAKEDIRQEVKGLFYQEPDYRKQALQLKKEIYQWMLTLHDWEQKIILMRFSGRDKAGLTFPQIGEELNQSGEWVRFQLLRLAREKLTSLSPEETPVLYRIAHFHQESRGLSQSAKKTFHLLKQGKDPGQIASLRGLRMGTVEDHIVEIALAEPTFDISPFVDKEKQRKIVEVIHTYGTRKLREIKRLVGEGYTFLEIRLVCGREAVTRGTWIKNR